MAVAFVAYKRLNPQTRARVDTLVKLNPNFGTFSSKIPAGTSAANKRMMLFMLMATWPDFIKSDGHVQDGTNRGNTPPTDGTADNNEGYTDRAMHKYWHFIDLPFSPDNTPLEDPPESNAKNRIAEFRKVLGSNSASDPLKSYDLVWLLHLVGDVHQPLHATSRFTQTQTSGDGGGNDVTVRDGSATRSLHSFWDGILGTSKKPADGVALGQSLAVAPAAAGNDVDVSNWLDESFKAAKATVYKKPPIGVGKGPFTITAAYRNSAKALARKRMALAGARLANILNQELK
jgi:hypothetical protein